MILDEVARLLHDAADAIHNTLNLRTIEVYFQTSPGVAEDTPRGITGLEYRVTLDGVETQTGTTSDDGLVTVALRPGVACVLELMFGGAAVAQYNLTVRDDPLEPDTGVLGQQRRLRTLGYQLGRGGSTNDGCDGDMGHHTDKAIQDFQIDAGLAFDSEVGPNTRRELNDAMGGSAQGAGP